MGDTLQVMLAAPLHSEPRGPGCCSGVGGAAEEVPEFVPVDHFAFSSVHPLTMFEDQSDEVVVRTPSVRRGGPSVNTACRYDGEIYAHANAPSPDKSGNLRVQNMKTNIRAYCIHLSAQY